MHAKISLKDNLVKYKLLYNILHHNAVYYSILQYILVYCNGWGVKWGHVPQCHLRWRERPFSSTPPHSVEDKIQQKIAIFQENLDLIALDQGSIVKRFLEFRRIFIHILSSGPLEHLNDLADWPLMLTTTQLLGIKLHVGAGFMCFAKRVHVLQPWTDHGDIPFPILYKLAIFKILVRACWQKTDW